MSYAGSIGKESDAPGGCNNCCRSIPFASIFATILVVGGVVVFSLHLYDGMKIVKTVMSDYFQLSSEDLKWVDQVRTGLIAVAAVMAFCALLKLLYGFLVTGRTREDCCRRGCSNACGKFMGALFIFLTWMFHIVWLAISCFAAFVVLSQMMLTSMCDLRDSGSCLDLKNYGIEPPALNGTTSYKICDDDTILAFCDDVATMWVPGLGMLAGAVAIVLGFLHYMGTLTANYVYLRKEEWFEENYNQDMAMMHMKA